MKVVLRVYYWAEKLGVKMADLKVAQLVYQMAEKMALQKVVQSEDPYQQIGFL